jgi:hypothetical protein
MSNNTSCCYLLFLSFHCYSAFAAREEFTITAAKIDRYASSLHEEKTKAQHLTAAILGRHRDTPDGLQEEEGHGSRYDRYSGTSYQSGDPTEHQEGYEEMQQNDSSSSSVGVPPPTTGQLRLIRGTILPWLVPVLGCFVSYQSFGQVSKLFLRLVQWASSNTWIPRTREDIDLQASVVVSDGCFLACCWLHLPSLDTILLTTSPLHCPI